jgi:outer membrane receptor protein involved in Fe transport
VPTLNELYRPFVLFPVTTRANAELAPERLTGVEGGIVYSRGTTADGFTLTAFVNRVEGAIANVTIGPNLRQRANLPAIRAQGLEFTGRVSFALFGVVPSLQVTAAWADAEVEGGSIAPALSGLRPAQAPRFSGSIAMAVLGPGPLLSTIVLRHGGRQFEDDRNVDILSAYTALDLSGTIPMNERLSLSLSAENVTNTRILTRNSGGGSIDLGAPRSIRLTLRLF